jgi:hypothetical protein
LSRKVKDSSCVGVKALPYDLKKSENTVTMKGFTGEIQSSLWPCFFMEDLMKLLKQFASACSDGKEYFESQKSMKEAWFNCKNTYWMIWALEHLYYQDDKNLRLFACKCACDTPLPNGRYTYELLTDKRSRDAIEAAILFSYGKITEEDLSAAIAAASDAARDAASAAARYAARDAARYAARDAARDAASDAARYAARAAAIAAASAAASAAARAAAIAAASDAARDAARDAAIAAARAAQSDFLREFIKWEDVEKHIKKMK